MEHTHIYTLIAILLGVFMYVAAIVFIWTGRQIKIVDVEEGLNMQNIEALSE